jgi:Transposase, Mutator family
MPARWARASRSLDLYPADRTNWTAPARHPAPNVLRIAAAPNDNSGAASVTAAAAGQPGRGQRYGDFLSAKGLTHGEIAAHLAAVYGAEVSKQTITTITGRVADGMTEWQSRPLDPVYAVILCRPNISIVGLTCCSCAVRILDRQVDLPLLAAAWRCDGWLAGCL